MVILAAEKRKKVADTKLRAVEQSILEERIWQRIWKHHILCQSSWVWRTLDHVPSPGSMRKNSITLLNRTKLKDLPYTINHGTDSLKPSTEPEDEKQDQFASFIPRGFAGYQVIYKPSATSLEAAITNQYIEGITHTNEKIVASLVRQTSLNATLTCFAEIRYTREKILPSDVTGCESESFTGDRLFAKLHEREIPRSD